MDASPRVELGPLAGQIGYALRRAQLAVFADFIRTLADVDLRPGQYSVLTLVAENPGVLQRRVGETLGIKTANLVPLLHELERRRLTRRVAIDRRSNGLYVTAKGRTLVDRAHALCEHHHQRVAAKIGDAECRRLLESLFRIADLDVSEPAEQPRAM